MVNLSGASKTKLVIFYKPELLIYSLALMSFCLLMFFLTQTNQKHLFQGKQFYKTFLVEKNNPKTTNQKPKIILSNPDPKNHFNVINSSFNLNNQNQQPAIYFNNEQSGRNNELTSIEQQNDNINQLNQQKKTQNLNESIQTNQQNPIKSKTLKNKKSNINQTNQFTEYKVLKGDCLWKIAKKFNVSIDTLIACNHIENPDIIQIEKTIKIPV